MSIFFICGLTKNIKCWFFFKILSPIIVKKYLAQFLLVNMDGYKLYSISWIVSVSGIQVKRERSRICLIIFNFVYSYRNLFSINSLFKTKIKLTNNNIYENKLFNKELSLIGLSHHKNTIDNIEKIIINKNKLPKFCKNIIRNNIADEIIVLSKGEIIERGNHEQLINNKSAYYKFCMLQGLAS